MDLSLLLPPCPAQLWTFPLNLPEAPRQRLRALLNDEERARADRFIFEIHRNRFICAHGLLRTLLGQVLGVPPEDVAFATEAGGKPILATALQTRPERLHFNLSHSGDYGLLGVSWGRVIGVDLEILRSTTDHAALARRCFSADEVADWKALPPAEREDGFFLAWTRKEAFIKATGEGLRRELRSFSVTLSPHQRAELYSTAPDKKEKECWQLFNLEPPPGYKAALCLEATPQEHFADPVVVHLANAQDSLLLLEEHSRRPGPVLDHLSHVPIVPEGEQET